MSRTLDDLNAFELNDKIAELEATLLAGETTSTIDGTTTTVDLAIVNQQLVNLYHRRDQLLQRPEKKPMVATIILGGRW